MAKVIQKTETVRFCGYKIRRAKYPKSWKGGNNHHYLPGSTFLPPITFLS